MTQSHVWLVAAAVAMTACLIGYLVGRRAGVSEAARVAAAEAPLRLRAEALAAGRCPVCGRRGHGPADAPTAPRRAVLSLAHDARTRRARRP